MKKIIVNKNQLFEAFLNETGETNNFKVSADSPSELNAKMNDTFSKIGEDSTVTGNLNNPSSTGNTEITSTQKKGEPWSQETYTNLAAGGNVLVTEESKIYTKQQILEMRMKRNGALFTKKELTEYLLNQ